jgi:hypothetical protein
VHVPSGIKLGRRLSRRLNSSQLLACHSSLGSDGVTVDVIQPTILAMVRFRCRPEHHGHCPFCGNSAQE